ncbi:MAG: type IV pilus secretin PilQ [Gammaproteobacteria bacterium]
MTLEHNIRAISRTPTCANRHSPSLRQRWSRAWLLLGALLAPGLSAAQSGSDTATNKLQDISYSALPGDRVQVTLTLSGPAPQPLSFTIDNPARIALDLPATSNALATKTQAINVGMARSVNTAEARGRTRVVLNLTKLVPYETRIDGNKLIITIEGATASASAEPAAVAAPVAAASTAPATAYPAVAAGKRIDNVDFRRGEHGEGRVVVTLSDPSTPVDMKQEGNNVIVDFVGADLPETLARRLDVLDFATPVKTVDTTAKSGKVHMVIAVTGESESLAYQTGNQYTVEVKPISKEKKAEEQKAKFGFTGERLSLNFQNIEVRAVLQLIADFTNLNLVTSDTVQGNITLRLKNVPWDQALDIILRTKGLAMRQNGNVILVAPAEEIASREKAELEAAKAVEELAPLRSEFVQINYAKAADLAALIKAKENSLLSARGSVTIDERTNTLLVQDTADKLADIRKLVATLDIPVRQVLIESRIVIANDDFNRELGVRFGATGFHTDSSGRSLSTGGNLNATNAINTTAATGGTVAAPPLGDRLNVNLPVANPAGRVALALLGKDYLLDLELSALQSEGRGEVISSPRVITANQKEALIEQGVEIPYIQPISGTSTAPSVSFKKAVLSLKVTPQITPDDRVIMDLTVTKDSVGEIFQGVPSINTREVTTQVLVDNGATVVLGGVYEQTRNDQVNRVPFLGELPGVGVLFRNTNKIDKKSELLIFVTPKIVKESLGVN